MASSSPGFGGGTRSSRTGLWLALAVSVAAAGVAASCGGSNGGDDGNGGEGGGAGGGEQVGDYLLSPADPTLTVTPDEPVPSVDFGVTKSGDPVEVEWSVDSDLGTIDDQGIFVPTGRGAGTVTVTATVGDVVLTTTVTITLDTAQNGAGPSDPDPTAEPGPGGYMGVGGEGLGGEVTEEQRGVLDGEPTADPEMELLYPYDGTVWPQGMLPPLLMWDGADAAANEAVRIELTATNYSYVGYFGRPARLGANARFVRHPIPLDAWQAATRSAGGGELHLRLVVARDGEAYGPLEATWQVAGGVLQGCVYYQSYFTKLVTNYESDATPGRWGGATLGIRPGSTDPVLVAGFDSDDHSGCRVCHSVSANGSRMIVQQGVNYEASSDIDLQNGYTDTDTGTNGTLGWVGLSPDGALGISSGLPMTHSYTADVDTALYDMTTGQEIPSTGLEGFVTRAGLPAFSLDGSMVAFNLFRGPGNDATGEGDGTQLVLLDFDRDTSTFSNVRVLYDGEQPPLFPSFYPNAAGVVWHLELENGDEYGDIAETNAGGRGELWWTDLATLESRRLDRVNGFDDAGDLYLPTSATHPADNEVNYEPSVSPIASGGFAWVVFMSRRQYGNVITAEPWASNPNHTDLSVDFSPKKLWVAAIKLDPEPGEDPSYPAFYLPAQEIQATNSRGFWTSDPCVYTGQM